MKSDAVILHGTPADVYRRLTNPAELDKILHQAVDKARSEGKELPADLDSNLEKITFTEDSISFSGGPTGNLTFRLGDVAENKSVQYVGEGTPVAIIITFDLTPEGMDECFLALGVQADIPFLLRPMVQTPMRKGLDTFVNILSKIPSWR